MKRDSLVIFPYHKPLNLSMGSIDIFYEPLIDQFLMVLIEFPLHLLLGHFIWHIFQHYAEISSSNSVVIHHSLIGNLKVIYYEKRYHPTEQDSHH